MKVLCIIPPYLLSYFNAGHHLPVFQVAAYLRKKFPAISVTAVDGAILNYTWRDLCDLLVKQYDVIAAMNDFDGIDTFRRFVKYARELCPDSKLITFGRISKLATGFFKRLNFDAIVCSGDYESGVENYIRYLSQKTTEPCGITLRKGDTYTEPLSGIYLDPSQWVLPDVTEIPYADHNRLYRDDLKKYTGIPQRMELVISSSRGCPVNCSFCDVPLIQGRKERKLTVDVVVNYIEESFKLAPVEYVTFYAATFGTNRKWVEDFCNRLIDRGSIYPWKCVTTISTLDEPIIKMMAKSACVRIGIGLETFEPVEQQNLPKSKRKSREDFEKLYNVCQTYGIELNVFILLGLEGCTRQNLEYTFNWLLSKKVRIRPTVLTPYYLINDSMDEDELNNFNRQLFFGDDCGREIRDFGYRLLYNNKKDRSTDIMKKIKKRDTAPPCVALGG